MLKIYFVKTLKWSLCEPFHPRNLEKLLIDVFFSFFSFLYMGEFNFNIYIYIFIIFIYLFFAPLFTNLKIKVQRLAFLYGEEKENRENWKVKNRGNRKDIPQSCLLFHAAGEPSLSWLNCFFKVFGYMNGIISK